MDKNELLRRTKEFSIRVFKLVEKLPKSKASEVVAFQLLKSSSSVAANYRAVNRAKSRKDFINKIKVVLEEADESNFWLSFISDVGLLMHDDELTFLIQESDEFIAIFTAASKTLNKLGSKSSVSKEILNLKS